MMKKVMVSLLILGFCFSLGAVATGAQTSAPDKRAVDLLNKMMEALLIENEEESAKSVQLLVHKSLLTRDGRSLSRDVREFSFRKAHSGAKFYSVPVVVTRVRQRSLTAIGFQETAEEGTEFDYFISKKEGAAGLPAPVRVFFPKSGGQVRISYMGSL